MSHRWSARYNTIQTRRVKGGGCENPKLGVEPVGNDGRLAGWRLGNVRKCWSGPGLGQADGR